MILESETGLTTEQYNNLVAARQDAVYRLTAYRWLPEFETDINLTLANKTFDLINHDDTLYAVSNSFLKVLESTVWNDITSFAPPSGVNPDVPLSLISDTDLYVFAQTTTGIKTSHYDGSSWTSWTEIVTDSTIVFMAATASNRVHYITYDSTYHYYHFKVYDAGVITDSLIYWPLKINGFDAVHYNGQDVLVISSHTPGAISAKYVNSTVVKYALDAGGLLGFTYKYGSWSDHYEIDVLDELHLWRYRNVPRLSIANSRLYLTSFCGDGSEHYSLSFYRSFCSHDGRHWSHGEYLSVPTTSLDGLVIALIETTLYTFQSDNISKAPSTLLFGISDSSQQLDISDKVVSLTVNRQDMQQLDTIINNETNWIANSILDGNQVIALILETGYWSNGEKLLIQTGIYESDGFVITEDLPEHSVQLTGRDWLAWMQTKYQAESFKFWKTPMIGGDEYTDNTGTGYGGEAFTGVVTGSWITQDNHLFLNDNSSEGIVLATWAVDIWNGQFEAKYQLTMTSDHEYVGLLFRAQDKDNGWIYYYTQDDDKLHLIYRIGGVTYTSWSSSTMSWNDTDEHWLRVEFYYCRVLLYTASGTDTPGVWTLVATILIPGTLIESDPINEIGAVGYIAKGHSDQENWTPDPGVISPSYITGVTPPAPVADFTYEVV